MRDCKKFCWRKGSYTPEKPKPASPQEHNYSLDYLTTEALEDGTISFNIHSTMGTEYITSISYSTDNGNSWTTVNNVDNKEQNLVIPVSVSQGDKVLWKGDAQQTGLNGDSGSFFSSDCEFNAYGNVMSLLYGDNFIGQTDLTGKDYVFYALFNSCNKLINTKNLILPATTLANGCYSNMFDGCTSLITAPELPATTLAQSCYYSMFLNCTSLTTAPELPATTLTPGCYQSMFNGCTLLTSAPELPATTLAIGCYQEMFNGCTSLTTGPSVLSATTLANTCYAAMFQSCTSLTTAPELPATTLANNCYSGMFNGCTSLNYIKCLATDISASNCTKNWILNVAATGTFVKDATMENWTTGDNGIPTGWTVQDA